MYYFFCFIAIFASDNFFGQDISLYQQFNGRYDFTFVGNTLNSEENNSNSNCVINTSSTESLNLSANDEIENVFLYWAGSGTGDFNITLNGNAIESSRNFSFFRNNLNYFSAFADVTNLVQSIGNGDYTVAELDINQFINPEQFCNNRTNFGGWAMLIVYKNNALPLNQLNVYDGLEGMQGLPNGGAEEINITLNSLNVVDNIGAKIGFIAWEGDEALSNLETLQINGYLLSNAVNPETNAFNGTNSITGATDLYNMDLDIYDIQNNIQTGNQIAQIKMTSAQDFVLINTIVTKLNSELPDATIAIDNASVKCNSRIVTVDFTVFNLNSTLILPPGVPIGILINNVYVQYTETITSIEINGSLSDTISFVLPDEISGDLEIIIIVDYNSSGVGIIKETDETNNFDAVRILMPVPPAFNILDNLKTCNKGFRKGTFDFSDYQVLVKIDLTNSVSFFETFDDAVANVNPIVNTLNYTTITPVPIFVKIEDEYGCYSITTFQLLTENCPPKVYNLVATDVDNFYDTFLIDGLRDIFINFKLSIYNRWGMLIWTGNNNTEDWDGKATKGTKLMGNELPDGTYYYILELNDPDYKNPITGFLHLKK